MVINSRSKGQRGEREVRDILQKIIDDVAKELKMEWAPEIKRNLMQSMEGGHDLVGVPGLAVEVKYQENTQIDKWWKQTLAQAERENGIPVLIFRKSHAKWQVVMNALLPVGDAAPVSCRVTISLATFQAWFYEHLLFLWSAKNT